MLSEFIQAVISHLQSLNMPVCQADCVPGQTPPPYITLAIAAPLGDAPGTLTLTAWHDTNAGRIALAEQLAALIPSRGLHLPLTSGHAILTGATASFLQEKPLLGMRLVWKLRFYPAG